MSNVLIDVTESTAGHNKGRCSMYIYVHTTSPFNKKKEIF